MSKRKLKKRRRHFCDVCGQPAKIGKFAISIRERYEGSAIYLFFCSTECKAGWQAVDHLSLPASGLVGDIEQYNDGPIATHISNQGRGSR